MDRESLVATGGVLLAAGLTALVATPTTALLAGGVAAAVLWLALRQPP